MGKVAGFEISSQDPEKAVKFYSEVFGWETSDPQWGYWPVSMEKGNGVSGGISKGPSDFPHGTRIQIEVDSIDDTIAKAKKNGAMVVRDKMEFDEFFLAYLVDPAGVGFGLIQQK
ncbi:VOC family protein [Virgibacillus doumboii]|uniref:VOC family protein n=1 Tax=Virgibacillus doumboii TaxID=2697503 RepID=UPI0013DF65B0|nr:VOC family protein [Virgibacillus doumboii]